MNEKSSLKRAVAFSGASRVVVKIGSAVLREGARFDRVTFVSLARDLAALREAGLELILVCSGAVALGLARLECAARPKEMAQIQALAAIGQGRLMRMWSDELDSYGIPAGQVLLTHDDLRSRRRFLVARHTLRALLEMGALPIINENDTVAFDELKLGDNDMLSSQVVSLTGASMLILLSDVEGLFDRRPQQPGARLISRVEKISEELLAQTGASSSGLGSGGMKSKLMAVQQVNRMGVPALIASGKQPQILRCLYAGDPLGTWFDAAAGLNSRKHWIAYAQAPQGTLRVDQGAKEAIIKRGRSLLPVGVLEVQGEFRLGDPVALLGPAGEEFARGLVAHPPSAIREALGRRSSESGIDPSAPEVVHRDDLVLLPEL